MTAVPNELKAIKPFIMRAAELERSSHPLADIIAFSCRAYAVKKALPMLSSLQNPASTVYVTGLMDSIEAAKAAINEKYTSDSGDLSPEKEANIVQSFALEIFKKADEEYRNNKGNKDTAKAFYAAATYLEVAEGSSKESNPKLETIRKAAKFKAAEIMNAVNSGQKPMFTKTSLDIDEDKTNDKETTKISSKLNHSLVIHPEDDLPNAPVNTFVNSTSKDSFSDAGDDDDNNNNNQPPKLHELPINARMSVKSLEFFHDPTHKNIGIMSKTAPPSEFLEAEGFARKAVDQISTFGDISAAVESFTKALKCLKENINTKVKKNVSDSDREDAIECALFAARTLETSGLFMNSKDTRAKAKTLLKQGLSYLT